MVKAEGGSDRVLLGRIGAAHGVRGEVRIQSFCDAPLDIASYGPLETKRGEEIVISSARQAKTMVIASIEGVRDRNVAETLNGVELYVPRSRLPTADDEDDFYYADLIGLVARTPDGVQLGKVSHIADFGAGDVIEVALDAGGSALFSFTKAVVPEIDLSGGYLVLVPPAEIEAREAE